MRPTDSVWVFGSAAETRNGDVPFATRQFKKETVMNRSPRFAFLIIVCSSMAVTSMVVRRPVSPVSAGGSSRDGDFEELREEVESLQGMLRATVKDKKDQDAELVDLRSKLMRQKRVIEATEDAQIGTIVAFAGEGEPPAGWLRCDGEELSGAAGSQYRTLFERIGTTWGAGSGTDTFKLPDLGGYFLRGVTTDTTRDPDSFRRFSGASLEGEPDRQGVGTYQDSDVVEHNHEVMLSHRRVRTETTPGSGHFIVLPATHNSRNPTSDLLHQKGLFVPSSYPPFPGQKGNSWGTRIRGEGESRKAGSHRESRPKNAYVQFIIKAYLVDGSR